MLGLIIVWNYKVDKLEHAPNRETLPLTLIKTSLQQPVNYTPERPLKRGSSLGWPIAEILNIHIFLILSPLYPMALISKAKIKELQ